MLMEFGLVGMAVALGPLMSIAPCLAQEPDLLPANEDARRCYGFLVEDIDRLDDLSNVDSLRADIEELALTLEFGEGRCLAQIHYRMGCRLFELGAAQTLREREFRESRDLYLEAGFTGFPAWQNLGVALQELGRWDEAVEETTALCAAYEQHQRPMDAAEALLNLGNTLFLASRYDLALEQIELAERRFRAMELGGLVADALLTRASILRETARFAEAIAVSEEAVRIAAVAGPAIRRVKALTTLANCLAALDMQESAIEQYLRAREIAVEHDLGVQAANLDSALGSSYVQLGRLESGRARLEAALDILRADVHGSPWRTTMFGLASALEQLGELDGARAIYDELGHWAREHGDVDLEADLIQNLVSFHERAGDLDGANALVEEALEINRLLGRPLPCAELQEGLGLLALRRGEPLAALSRFDAAAEEVGGMLRRQVLSLGDASSLALRTKFHQTLSGAMESLTALETPGDPELASAYRVLQTFHGAAFLGMLAEGRTELPSNVSTALAGDLETTLESLKAVEAERAAMLMREPSRFTGPGRSAAIEAARADLDPLDEKIVELERQLAGLEERLRAASGYFKAVDYLAPATPAEVAAALPPGAVLVEYVWGDEHVHGFAIGGGETRHLRLMPVTNASEAIRKALDLVRQGFDDDARPLLSKLGRELVQPLLAGREAEALIVAPDGDLCLIPFALFRAGWSGAEEEPERFLVQALAISYVHSGTVLRELAGEGMTERSASRRFFGLGDPRREPGDAPGEADGGRLEGAALEVVQAARSLDPDSTARARWEALSSALAFDPDAHPEGPVRTEAATVVLGTSASEHLLKTADDVRDAQVVHLGCHGVAHTASPALSCLHLAPGEGEDGLLTLRELSRLELGARLLVLSACETQSGPLLAFEGTSSFARAALQAGAGAVLATSWKVDDDAARELVGRFYDVAGGELAKLAHSLRLAQSSAIETRRPMRDWAGYVLWGIGK